MKQLKLLIIGLLSISAQAQDINFTDPDFKAFLVANPLINANGDGEITLQEAAATAELHVNGIAIDNLDGLQYFTNVSNFYLSGTSVTNLSLPFSNLGELYISENPLLTSLNLGALSSVDYFGISNNDALASLTVPFSQIGNDFSISGNDALASLSFPSLAAVDSEFYIGNNASLGSIDWPVLSSASSDIYITGNASLQTLDLSNREFSGLYITNNGLTSINLGNTSCQYTLDLSNNQLASVDLSTLTAGYGMYMDLSGNNYTQIALVGPWAEQQETTNAYPNLKLNNTKLTSLSLDPVAHLGTLTIQNNAYLETLSFRNGIFETCPGGYCAIGNFAISNNPALSLICTDAFEVYGVQQESWVSGPDWVHQTIDPNIAVNTNCFFTPAGAYNTVAGFVRYDADANGCSASDAAIPHIPITATGYQATAYSNTQGGYYAYTNGGQITLTPIVNTAYFTVTPAAQTLNFMASGGYQTADFCIAPNGVHNDLRLSVTNLNSMRPGFETTYNISVTNDGTVAQTSALDISFDPTLSFVSATLAPTSNTPGAMHWDLPAIAPFQTMTFSVKMLVNTPTATPPVNVGDAVNLQGTVTGLADETPNNNTAIVSQTAVNAFDPNEKTVAQGSIVGIGHANSDGLTYSVHFQNLGNVAATRVIVSDVLDSDFDLNSVRIIGASHACEIRRIADRLEFWFEDINLAPASQNEAASQGFVTYAIKSNTADDLNYLYSNTADIYFDFNPAITTNTVETTTILLSTPEALASEFAVYPNPANTNVNIVSKNRIPVKAQVFNLSGQLLIQTDESNELSLDVSGLSSGTYLVKLLSKKGKETRKLIKL